MIKNISKKIKHLLILLLCCSITFQSSLLIGSAEEANVNVEDEISNIPTESTNNLEEELNNSTTVETKDESIEKQEEIIEEDPEVQNIELDVDKISSISDLKTVSLSNPYSIGSGYVINTTTLNVRSGPSTNYSKIGTLNAYETVEILGTSGSWYKIDFNGIESYVSAAYLALNALDKGIDVSKWNGNIDWQSVKKSGVSYAIIRAGYGTSTVDEKFHKNIQGALKAGIKVGVYWFSYATTVEKAEKEAEKCLQTLAPYKGKLTYPVFFDYEYDSVNYATKQGITITKDLATNIAKSFLNKVKSNGYLTGLYTNTDFSGKYFHDELVYSNNIWHAQYNTVNTFNKPYSIWQYSDKGMVSGINGSVDLNYTNLKTFDINYTPSVGDFYITTTNANITVGPFSDATIIYTVRKNNYVEILDKSISGWYYIQYNGIRGYLPSKSFSKSSLTNETGITIANLKLKVGPFDNATSIYTVKEGHSVEILDKEIPDWYYVEYNGQRGYVPSQYVPIEGFTISKVNLTIGPFTYATVVSTIDKGDSVDILDKGISGWYYVQYDGKRGYLPSHCVSINGIIAETGITTNNLNLTIGPFTYATVLSSVNKGDYVEILDKSIPGWYYVQYNKKRGYLPSQCVPINGSSSEVGITINNLELTIGPFTYATVLSTIKNSSVVEILDKGISGWYYVQYDGKRGYLPSKYVSQSEIGVTTTNLNLTVGPFTYATVSTSIPKNSTIEILDKGISGWYYIQYNGQRGYVPIKYVK